MIYGIAANSPSDALWVGYTNPNLWLAGMLIRSKWGAGSFLGSAIFFGVFFGLSFGLGLLGLDGSLNAFLIFAMFMLGALGAALTSAGIASIFASIFRIGADK